MRNITPEQIDELLPQTQCGLCGHGGCMPYAEAMIYENAAINLCPPGGVKTLRALGELLQQDPSPYLSEMEQKTKTPAIANIRESECIGCVKCIQVCPVDAILGSAKQMHTVITSHCTGCELCVPACPVDCIDLIHLVENNSALEKKQQADAWRQQFNARQQRIKLEISEKKQALILTSNIDKQNYIQAAINRAKKRK